jgi:hypothetical protein
MIQALLTLGTFAFLGAAITGLGSVVLPGALLSRRFAAGAIILYLVLSMAGWLGLFSSYLLWVIMVLSLVAFVLRMKTVRLPEAFGWLAAGLLLLLPLALLPPASRDAMNHHLYLPRLWLESGAIVRPDWSSYFSYPYMVETFYGLAGGTIGFAGARMVSLLGLAACGIALLETRELGRRVRILSVVVLFSIPEVLRNGSWAFTDSFTVFFSLMAFLELVREEGTPMYAAVWAAAAAMCKYNALPVLAAVLLLLPMRFGWRMKGKPLIAAAVLLLCIPWALPNIVQWGNPVYPLLRGVFGPPSPLSERAARLLSESRALAAQGTTLLDYALLPVRLSVSGRWDDPRLYDGSSGPLLLVGSVLFLVLGRRRREFLILPAVCLLALAALMGPAVRIRYLLPGLAMLSVPAAIGIDALRERARPWLTVLLVAVCLGWTGTKLYELYMVERPWTALSGDYLANRLGYIPFYREAETVVDVGDVTLFVNMGNRAFYFPSRVEYSEQRFPVRVLEMLWRGEDDGQIAAELKDEGIGWLAMNMDYTVVNIPWELTDPELEVWRRFVAMRLRPVISVNPFVLFEVI